MIKSTDYIDTTTFTCHASNVFGNVDKTIHFVVTGNGWSQIILLYLLCINRKLRKCCFFCFVFFLAKGEFRDITEHNNSIVDGTIYHKPFIEVSLCVLWVCCDRKNCIWHYANSLLFTEIKRSFSMDLVMQHGRPTDDGYSRIALKYSQACLKDLWIANCTQKRTVSFSH